MAASNLACFWKQCKCATCRYVCSRCRSSIPFELADGCGSTECDRWNPLTWEQYKSDLGWTGPASTVTEMDFIKARYGIMGTEFDRLYQESIIKDVNGHLEFDTMVLFAELRRLRGVRPQSLKDACKEMLGEENES